ncbi:MAG TPA: hypothetical protein VIC61_10720, partial [Gammaproteobacteria bacterium]
MPASLKDIPRLIATSVVRGSQQGESHGGVYTIDFAARRVTRHIDWNKTDIDFTGRGWDRGLRGIAFVDGEVYIAASDELFVYDRSFAMRRSFRNPYLKHCHEICFKDHLMFLTSTGFDSLLVFDLKHQRFIRGVHFARDNDGWRGQPFDPNSGTGPAFGNTLHINMVHVDDSGLYVSGLRTNALLHVDGKLRISEVCNLPTGVHNARPFRRGVIFNDTNADCVRYVGRGGGDRTFPVPIYETRELQFMGVDDSKIARQGFGRGLCPIDERLLAAGSSPSTISIYDLDEGRRIGSVTLTMDVRNA